MLYFIIQELISYIHEIHLFLINRNSDVCFFFGSTGGGSGKVFLWEFEFFMGIEICSSSVASVDSLSHTFSVTIGTYRNSLLKTDILKR